MPDLMTYAVALIPLAIAGLLIWLYLRKAGGATDGTAEKKERKAVYQGVVKKDWVATGRIDFATQEDAGTDDPERPAEFRLLVEERRIVESIAGNENLEIQWRLATLKEAKVVIANYHKHLGDQGLIKTVFEEAPAAAPAPAASPATPAPAALPAIEAPPSQSTPSEAASKPPAESGVPVAAEGNS